MKTLFVAFAILLCSTMSLAALDTTAVLTVVLHGSGTSDHGDTTKLTSTPLVTSNTFVPAAGYYIDSVLVNGTNKGRKWTVSVTLTDSTNQTIHAYFSTNAYGLGSTQATLLAGTSGPKFSKFWTGNLLAFDSTLYILSLPYDLGGRPLIYGLQQVAFSDTIDLQLVLEGSVDNSTWRGVDSLNITTPETVGQYVKNVDLTLVRYPYWRIRFGTISSLLQGNIALAGRFNLFAITNLSERF